MALRRNDWPVNVRTTFVALFLFLFCTTAVTGTDDSARLQSLHGASREQQQRLLWMQLDQNNNAASRNAQPNGGNARQLRPSVLLSNPTPLELLVTNEHRYAPLDANPKPAATNHGKLQKLLGDNYDHEVMSILRPADATLRMNATISNASPRRADLNAAVVDSLRKKLQIGKQQLRKIERLLNAYTNCPVVHVWLDLGSQYWPRWFRESRCYQDKSRSCSIPSGMQCMANEHTNKTILRYHCRNETNKQTRICGWIKVSVPLITSCRCGCADELK